jgi:hypothetical protein
MTTLNWKAKGDGRYEALASRLVGGKYFIEWVESYYSEEYSERFECRYFDVDYQTKGGGGRGNVSRIPPRTLEQAKALAELDHDKRAELIGKYGDRIPQEAWSQLSREMLAYEERHHREAPTP